MTLDYRFQLHFICGHKETYDYPFLVIERIIGEELFCPICVDMQRVIRIIILDNQYQGHMPVFDTSPIKMIRGPIKT